jgi:hypothetical protein
MPWKNPKHVTRDLAAAAASFDEPTAAALCEDLIARTRREDRPFPLDEAKLALKALRSARMFPLMERVADTFIQSGQKSPIIRRQYAQALLDQGRIASAVRVLEEIASSSRGVSAGEMAEARGLLGRAYKQMYVDGHGEAPTRGRATLDRAVRCYYDVYKKRPRLYLWQGINAVALLRRGEEDGLRLKEYPEPLALADEILTHAKTLDAKKKADSWTFATALEAAVALGRVDEAQVWLPRYLKSKQLDAFALGSTRRQLLEVWNLDPQKDLGREVLPLLEARLLELSGAEVELAPARVTRREVSLEKVLGDTSYVPLAWYRRGLDRCVRVGRVETDFDPDRGFGTGFLIRGADLKGSLGDAWYLVTSAHVVSAAGVSQALRPEQARISFRAHPKSETRRWRVQAVRWESPPDRLDCAILELDAPVEDELPPYPIARARPVLEEGARVYIIGHPKGGTLSFSLNDNRLLDYDDRLLHYRAPTEGGSSGSPVFNQDWELLGLHHGGGRDMARLNKKAGRYAANEGIWIEAIRQGMA